MKTYCCPKCITSSDSSFDKSSKWRSEVFLWSDFRPVLESIKWRLFAVNDALCLKSESKMKNEFNYKWSKTMNSPCWSAFCLKTAKTTAIAIINIRIITIMTAIIIQMRFGIEVFLSSGKWPCSQSIISERSLMSQNGNQLSLICIRHQCLPANRLNASVLSMSAVFTLTPLRSLNTYNPVVLASYDSRLTICTSRCPLSDDL